MQTFYFGCIFISRPYFNIQFLAESQGTKAELADQLICFQE